MVENNEDDVCLKKKDHDLAIFTVAHANCHIAFIYMVNILGNTVNKDLSRRSHDLSMPMSMHINSEYIILFAIMVAYFL